MWWMLRVFGCMVASRGGYRMARGWHYAKLSLSNAPRLSFSDLCNLLFLFLYLCRFCVFVFFFCSHWSLVDVPLIFFCPADHVPDWQPRVLLGMVEARSVNADFSLNTNIRILCRSGVSSWPWRRIRRDCHNTGTASIGRCHDSQTFADGVEYQLLYSRSSL